MKIELNEQQFKTMMFWVKLHSEEVQRVANVLDFWVKNPINGDKK